MRTDTGDRKLPLVVIEGATSAGKSDIAVLVAKRIGGEVISADSMQVYRGMDIGTGKITEEEMQGVPHHLLSIRDPKDSYDLAEFVADAKGCIREIAERGAVPILCGGTGFYIQAVVKDLDFSKAAPSEEYRKSLTAIAEEKGNEALHSMLSEIDPAAANAIHPNNTKRVIRALEYFHETGERISEKNASEKEQTSPYNAAVYFIDLDRAKLYEKIDARVDRMLEAGLVAEVEALREEGLTKRDVSMQGLGYKELLRYLEGACSFEEAVYVLKRDTRHFAKRQLTWFRADRFAKRIDRDMFSNSPDAIAAFIEEDLKEKGIIC